MWNSYIMQIVREVTAESIEDTFPLFLKAKSSLRRRKIEFRSVSEWWRLPPSTISNKNVYSAGSTEPNSKGYDSRFGVPRKLGRCQRRREHDEGGGDGREIENVCTCT